MPNFMMIYRGDATDMAAMTEEQQAEIGAKWGAWMGKVGPALKDLGTPFGPGVCVVDNGTTDTPTASSGYSIIEAADLAGAQGLADGHPYLSDGEGNYAIDIYEMMPTPDM